MRVFGAIAIGLGVTATGVVAGDQVPLRDMQNMLDHGFKVIAEGKLMSDFRCDPELAGITLAEIRRGYTCPSGHAVYGSFKRLKGDDGEFVCLSSRDWACYPSQSLN